MALEGDHRIHASRIDPLEPPLNILPTSMATDAHAAHFRHSYTQGQARPRHPPAADRGPGTRASSASSSEEAYCLDVLQQVEALTAAADQVALLLVEDHIDGCLTHAIETGQGRPYVDEVMAVVRRTMGRRGATPTAAS